MACLYVACGMGGLIKAGMTADPKSRRRTLKTEFKKHADEMREVIFLGSVPNVLMSEHRMHAAFRDLLVRCPTGREWYASGDFNKAVALAEQITAESEGDFEAPAPKRRTRTEVKEGA